MEIDRHDAMLMELLKETKTIVGFLDSVFGFLARRTDFYHIMKSETDTLGFAAGVKEKLVLSALRKHQTIYENRENPFVETPPVSSQVEIECDDDGDQLQARETEIIEEPEGFQPNEYFNGAAYGNYCWGQTIADVEVHIRVPEHINSPKLLSVNVEPQHIRVREKGSVDKTIFEGKLLAKCKSAEAVWSLSGRKLQIAIDKVQEAWWDRFLDSEPQIDLSKMDCSRPIEELPEESQAVLEKLRWDQQQKLLGLPTSEEIKNRELLRAAWDAEGSPFKGQPFDPSIVKFN